MNETQFDGMTAVKEEPVKPVQEKKENNFSKWLVRGIMILCCAFIIFVGIQSIFDNSKTIGILFLAFGSALTAGLGVRWGYQDRRDKK